VDGADNGTVVVTNAHVVHPESQPTVQHMVGTEILQHTTELIAIDYPHDLAILSLPPSVQRTPPTLSFGDSARPGEDVFFCGYPLKVATPRIAKALIAGWDVYHNQLANGFEVACLVLDGSVNFGNSGGPVANMAGCIVGVTCAQNSQELLIAPSTTGLPEEQKAMLETLAQHLHTAQVSASRCTLDM